MAKSIMIQGTASNAGKSLIATALCRIFKQDGYSVAPFKSQNMALNSYITEDGLEMGRAQAVQAEAAGIAPDVRMNPVLLKPTSDSGSSIVVCGKAAGNMGAAEYFEHKRGLIPDIMAAYGDLARKYDIMVIEGAGSPAEINLKADDIVNMGMAKMAGAPVLLVADIDRGGAFASIYGTVMLLDEDERQFIKGTIINKFRGDTGILKPGLLMIEELTKIPVIGAVPFARVDIDDEDSLSERLAARAGKAGNGFTPDSRSRVPGQWAGEVDIAVIRLPKLSNFTHFNVFDRIPGASLRYVSRPAELERSDLIIIPDTEDVIGGLEWLRENGLEAAIKSRAAEGAEILGIGGGYQMLGRKISGPPAASRGGGADGIGLLNAETVLGGEKSRERIAGSFGSVTGALSGLSGMSFKGYAIRGGETVFAGGSSGSSALINLASGGGNGSPRTEGCREGNVCGTYIHGIFDEPETAGALIKSLGKAKGAAAEAAFNASSSGSSAFGAPFSESSEQYRQRQYDILADVIRGALDMKRVYEILEAGV